jgi:hypothetical protein
LFGIESAARATGEGIRLAGKTSQRCTAAHQKDGSEQHRSTIQFVIRIRHVRHPAQCIGRNELNWKRNSCAPSRYEGGKILPRKS